ncbi:MAG: YlbF family regulator [Clostridia bacterium]|nr:YlbF family regulator [Clostridia bacterium]
MSQDIMEKARELADALADSSELANLRDAEVKMFNDSGAQVILDEFQGVQEKIHEAYNQGEEPDEGLKKQAKGIEEKMKGNPNIASYIDAQQEFESLLQSVNTVISNAISGEEGGCGPGCGGGCC